MRLISVLVQLVKTDVKIVKEAINKNNKIGLREEDITEYVVPEPTFDLLVSDVRKKQKGDEIKLKISDSDDDEKRQRQEQ